MINRDYDVCVVGNWACQNYGAHLTQYALYSVLKSMGKTVLMVETTDEYIKLPNFPSLFKINPYKEDDLSEFYHDILSMKELNEVTDTFIVGSDQLWVWKLFWYAMDVYTLSFVNSNKRKIAYATSFGNRWTTMSEREKEYLNFMLGRFDKISIREKFGIEYCKSNFDLDVDNVLDPVFLCDYENYHKLAEKSDFNVEKKYLFCYVIWPNERIAELIRYTAKMNNLEIICIGDAVKNHYSNWSIKLHDKLYIEDWLKLIRNSEMVITDSFHAFCFSIIFRKKIIPFGTVACLDRMISVADALGMKPLVDFGKMGEMSFDEILLYYDYDYNTIYNNLASEVERSRKWLNDSLEVKTKNRDRMWDAFGVEFLNNRKINAKSLLSDLKKDLQGKTIVCWGTGRFFERNKSVLEKLLEFDFVYDSNSEKWGKTICGKQSLSCMELQKIDNVAVIVTIENKTIYKEIEQQAKDLGIKFIINGEDFIEKYRWALYV